MQRQPRKHPGILAGKSAHPCIVLCSRGYSFEDRLPKVMKYAERNGITSVVLLHCPEKKYTEAFKQDVTLRADNLFAKLKSTLRSRAGKMMELEMLCRKGLLEDNLAALLRQKDVRMVFVGMKMLDYRPDAVKTLPVAFYFLGT